MKMSEKLMSEMMAAVNEVLLKHKGVVDSYRFKMALVATTVDLTLKIRDMSDDELRFKDKK